MLLLYLRKPTRFYCYCIYLHNPIFRNVFRNAPSLRHQHPSIAHAGSDSLSPSPGSVNVTSRMRPPGGPARGVWTARDAVRCLEAKAPDAVRGPPCGVPPPFACKWQAASRSGLSHREFFDISALHKHAHRSTRHILEQSDYLDLASAGHLSSLLGHLLNCLDHRIQSVSYDSPYDGLTFEPMRLHTRVRRSTFYTTSPADRSS